METVRLKFVALMMMSRTLSRRFRSDSASPEEAVVVDTVETAIVREA